MWLSVVILTFLVHLSAVSFIIFPDLKAWEWQVTQLLPAVIASYIAAHLCQQHPWLLVSILLISVGLVTFPIWGSWLGTIPWLLSVFVSMTFVWKDHGIPKMSRRCISIASAFLFAFAILTIFLENSETDITIILVYLAYAGFVFAWYVWSQRRGSGLTIEYVPWILLTGHLLHALFVFIPSSPPTSRITAIPIALFYGIIPLFGAIVYFRREESDLSSPFLMSFNLEME